MDEVVCGALTPYVARAFYIANGYMIDGPPDHKHGAGGYPMSKLLTLQVLIFEEKRDA